jgi:large subunit ribosomal protein L24
MKQKFSNKWVASKQPRKQVKYRANAPSHIRHNLMSSNLSKELRKKYGKRSFPIRKNDSVKIMRGEFKGKTGKIDSVDLKKLRVMIAGIFRSKKDGTKVGVYFNPSNLQIQELDLEDVKRREAIERKLKPIVEKETIKKQEFKKLPKPTEMKK